MYTYLIGWASFNKFYYGVRYSKTASPDDLWVTYFTSSKHVKRFAAVHGAPDIIQIRRQFGTRQEAIDWENRVLRRLRVVEDERFLNATYNSAIPVTPHPRIENLKHRKRFHELDEITQNRIREASRKSLTARWRSGSMTGAKNCSSENYSAAAKRRWADPQFKSRMKSRKWITDGTNTKFVSPDVVAKHLSIGWRLGRGG